MHQINAERMSKGRAINKIIGKYEPFKQEKKLKLVTLTLLPEDGDCFEIGTANGIATARLIRQAMWNFVDRRQNGYPLDVKLTQGERGFKAW